MIDDEHLQLLLDQRPAVGIRQVIATVDGGLETDLEGSGEERRCWEVPSWLRIALLIPVALNYSLLLATDDDT